MYTVFSRPLLKCYRAQFLSEATFFLGLCVFIRFTLPLVIVWNSDQFWLKQSSYREVPDVDFAKKFILLIDIDDHYLGYSTFEPINEAFRNGKQLIPLHIQNYEGDLDFDNKMDSLNLQIEIPVDLKRYNVFGLKLLLFFRYRLQRQIDLRMESMIFLEHQSIKAAQKAIFEGNLHLIQNVPFFHKGFDFRYNQPVIHEDFDGTAFTIDSLIRNYTRRDYYTSMTTNYRQWQTYVPVVNKKIETFNLEININYREQTFFYETGFWYLLKWALVQYVAVFVLVDFLLVRVKSYVFDHFLVASTASLSDIGLLKQTTSTKNM